MAEPPLFVQRCAVRASAGRTVRPAEPSFRQGEYKVGSARSGVVGRAKRAAVSAWRDVPTGHAAARTRRAPCMRNAHVTIQPTPGQPSARLPWSMEAGSERSPAYLPAWLSLAHGEVRDRRGVSVPPAPARARRRGSRTDVDVAIGEAPRRRALGRVPAEGWAFRLSRGERVTRTVAPVRAVAAISRSTCAQDRPAAFRGRRTRRRT
jgi:hypothetical protein